MIKKILTKAFMLTLLNSSIIAHQNGRTPSSKDLVTASTNKNCHTLALKLLNHENIISDKIQSIDVINSMKESGVLLTKEDEIEIQTGLEIGPILNNTILAHLLKIELNLKYITRIKDISRIIRSFDLLGLEQKAEIIENITLRLINSIETTIDLNNFKEIEQFSRFFGLHTNEYIDFVLAFKKYADSNIDALKLAVLVRIKQASSAISDEAAKIGGLFSRYRHMHISQKLSISIPPSITQTPDDFLKIYTNVRNHYSTEELITYLESISTTGLNHFLQTSYMNLTSKQVNAISSNQSIIAKANERVRHLLSEHANNLTQLQNINENIKELENKLNDLRLELNHQKNIKESLDVKFVGRGVDMDVVKTQFRNLTRYSNARLTNSAMDKLLSSFIDQMTGEEFIKLSELFFNEVARYTHAGVTNEAFLILYKASKRVELNEQQISFIRRSILNEANKYSSVYSTNHAHEIASRKFGWNAEDLNEAVVSIQKLEKEIQSLEPELKIKREQLMDFYNSISYLPHS